MRLSATKPSALGGDVPFVALLVGTDGPTDLGAGDLFERAAGVIDRKVFEGEPQQTALLHGDGGKGPDALLLVGVGDPEAVESETLRRAGAIVCREAAKLGARRAAIGAAGAFASGKRALPASALPPVGEGALLASYRYKGKEPETTPPRQVALAVRGGRADASIKAAQALGDAANLARDLGDTPSNLATPRHLTKVARKVAKDGGLRCRAIGEKQLASMGYGAILGVGQGSAEESFIIELEYEPARPKATVCLVGKGLTFDTGGISLKPSSKMEEMKYDMCGAAAVIGTMAAVAALKPKDVRVIGIVGTAENMPGGRAYKPGDVLTSGSGKTIEVINTDAEGRIVLADALHHATTFEPDAIIDAATLTGAIVVALGHENAGLFCRDDELAERLLAASDRTDERVWRMPTHDEYAEKLKSRWADIRNTTNSRDAGSCSAAQFLFSFVEGIPHAHVDIAGVANDTRERDYHDGGAVGFGVRLFYDALANW